MRDRIVFFLLPLGFLMQTALSLPLWGAGYRVYPLTPAFEMLGPSYFPGRDSVSLLFFIVVLTATAGVFFDKYKGWAVLVWHSGLLFLILLDVNRLQPWVYFYMLLLLPLVFKNNQDTRPYQQWIFISLYTWSGLHKLNPYFVEDNWPWLVEKMYFLKSLEKNYGLGYVLAFLEVLFAAALFFPKTRPAGRIAVITMHLGLAILLSPLVMNWNWVVIPWNLVSAALVWQLFNDKKEKIKLPKNRVLQLALIFAGIFPALYTFGYWPGALSWALYTNTQAEATFEAAGTPDGHAPFRQVWKHYAEPENNRLYLADWAAGELHVPPYAGPNVLNRTSQLLCNQFSASDSAGWYLLTVNPLRKADETFQRINCNVYLPE